MRPQLVSLVVGFVALAGGQSVGPDNITTMATAMCTTTGIQTYAFVDTASTTYQYMCGGGAGGALLTNVPAASGIRSWQDCSDWCDNTTVGSNGCSGFLYNQGVAYGNGPGQCALRYGGQSFASTVSLLSTRVAGLKSRNVVRPAPTFACPAVNSQTVIDTYGVQYLIACGYDTSGNSNQTANQLVQATNSWNDCFALCDTYNFPNTGNCTGFSYSGKPDGVGSGNCYIKVVQPAPKFATVFNTNYVGAIRLVASSTSTSSPSSVPATTTGLGLFSTSTDPAYISSTYSGLSSSSSSSSSLSLSLSSPSSSSSILSTFSSSSGVSSPPCSSTVTVSITWTPPSRAEL